MPRATSGSSRTRSRWQADSSGCEPKKLLRIVQRHSQPGRILDVGCSAGFFLELARTEGWEPWGVEISNDTAELARRRGLNVTSGTLEEAGYVPRSFDVLTMWDFLEHVEDPVATLATAFGLLREGGMLALSTPNVAGLFPRLSYPVAGLTGRWPHPEPPRHLFQFSRATVGRLLRQTGFELLATQDRRIPLAYTFGRAGTLLRAPKDLAYAAIFAPLAFIGPFLRAGDDLVVIARARRGLRSTRRRA